MNVGCFKESNSKCKTFLQRLTLVLSCKQLRSRQNVHFLIECQEKQFEEMAQVIKSADDSKTLEEFKNNVSDSSEIPTWIQLKVFEKLLKTKFPNYGSTTRFQCYNPMAKGENFSTLMLKIEFDIQMKDGSIDDSTSFVVKVPHDHEMIREFMEKNNPFTIENFLFQEVLPELESMYHNVGHEVQFGAKAYKLDDVDEKTNYVLLQDLHKMGFQNANRFDGLDMQHMKCVLRKLAQLHAASATRVAAKGEYAKKYTQGIYTPDHRSMAITMYASLNKHILLAMKSYKGHEEYYDSVRKFAPVTVDKQYEVGISDPEAFNVLNHGDCWTNNIMFKYDASGNIEETYFVDLQMPTYTTPALDLIYLIISSAKHELKVNSFDYFIKYYHDNLIESLKLLKYPKGLPTLKNLHYETIKAGGFAYSTLICMMGAALLPPTTSVNFENFVTDSEDGDAFKKLMYSNDNYRKNAEILLPWLNNRGALEVDN